MENNQQTFPTWEAARDYCIQLQEQGEIARAEEGYRQIQSQRPDDPTLLRLRGLALAQLDRPEEGLPLLQRATELAPRDPLCHLHLGFVLQKMDRLDQALVYFRESSRLWPQNPAPWVNIAAILLKQKHFVAGLDAAQRACKLAPAMPEAQHNLGFALLENQKFEEALAPLLKADELRPDYPDGLLHLGRVYTALGRLEEAEMSYRRCLEINARDLNAAVNLAGLWLRMGNLDAAVHMYHQILDIDPQIWEARSGLVSALSEMERIEEAVRLLDYPISDPQKKQEVLLHRVSLLSQLGRLEDAKTLLATDRKGGLACELANFTLSEPEKRDQKAILLRKALEQGTEHIDLLIQAGFVLGDYAHSQKDYPQAFDSYLRAHSLLTISEKYDHAAWLDDLQDKLNKFRQGQWASVDPGNHEAQPLPVFIIGMPRSGTSLLEQILDSHPIISGAGELRDFAQLDARLQREPVDFQQFATGHLENLQRNYPQARLVVDKMPHNFEHLGLIATCFPLSPILWCQRNPADTALSIWRRHFKGRHVYAHRLQDLGRHYAVHEQIIRKWQEIIPNPLMVVRYESVVEDLPGQIQQVLQFLDVEWNDACLEFHQNPRKVRTASRDQVRQPLYRHALGSAESYAPFLKEFHQALQEERSKENLT